MMISLMTGTDLFRTVEGAGVNHERAQGQEDIQYRLLTYAGQTDVDGLQLTHVQKKTRR